jgi:hypothetical protein
MRLPRQRRFDSQGGIEVGVESATVWELLRPEPEVGWVYATMTPAAADEGGSGGRDDGLLEEADLLKTVGKGDRSGRRHRRAVRFHGG